MRRLCAPAIFNLPATMHWTHNGNYGCRDAQNGKSVSSPHRSLACKGFAPTFDKRIRVMDEARAEGTDPSQQQLRSAIRELESKLNEMAELVAHVRHEINNPLTGVIGQAQLLLREELSPTARRRVETIEQLAGRIRDTVAQLREVQRTQLPSYTSQTDEADSPPRH
jgi:signal transduction histidine kinase